MLTLLGPTPARRHCDGLSRRSFVRIGAMGLGGLSLAQLLALESAAAESSGAAPKKRHKSLIMVFLCGGPPHQDMYDIKVDAPAEIRGEFDPIPTAVPGIEV